jgi:hypothetical protein
VIHLERTKETFTTTGTGSITVAGAASGFRTFAASLSADYALSGTVAKVGYFMIGAPGGADQNNWERGYGTFTTGTGVMTRTVIASSNGGALVSWSAGTKYIMGAPAAFPDTNAPGIFRGAARPGWLRDQSFWIDTDAAPATLHWFDGTDDIPALIVDETANHAAPWGVARPLAKTAAYTVVKADAGRLIEATSGTWTLALTAAATLGAGYWFGLRNTGTGVVTVDPNAAETIDGSTTLLVQPGESFLIACDGTDFVTLGRLTINALTEDTTPDPAADFLVAYDASAAALKKIKLLVPGTAVQTVMTVTEAVATGTTTIPGDDTIPQNTEGTEFMTVAITPKFADSTLVIEATALLAMSTAADGALAFFVDSTADAIAASMRFFSTTNDSGIVKLDHKLTSGSTAARTYKFRAGPTSAATLTFNGIGGARRFGAITKSSFRVTEYRA